MLSNKKGPFNWIIVVQFILGTFLFNQAIRKHLPKFRLVNLFAISSAINTVAARKVLPPKPVDI